MDVDKDVAKSFAEDFNFLRSSVNWQDAVKGENIDVVAIAAPNLLHKDIAIAALENGKHVYCEKPLSTNLQDAELMAEAATKHNRGTLVGYNYLCNPMLELSSRLIKEGHIGRPYFFRGVNDEDYMADPNIPYSWRCEKEKAGPGVLGDLATHLINLAEFLMGDIIEVVGKTFIANSERTVPGTLEVKSVENEDIASSIVTFVNGARGEISSSRTAWGRKNRLSFEIHGDAGMITFDQERMNEIKLYKHEYGSRQNGFKTIMAGPDHLPYDAFVQSAGHQIGFNDLKTIEVRNLLLGLTGQTKLYPTFSDALKTERVIDALLRSAEQNRAVSVST